MNLVRRIGTAALALVGCAAPPETPTQTPTTPSTPACTVAPSDTVQAITIGESVASGPRDSQDRQGFTFCAAEAGWVAARIVGGVDWDAESPALTLEGPNGVHATAPETPQDAYWDHEALVAWVPEGGPWTFVVEGDWGSGELVTEVPPATVESDTATTPSLDVLDGYGTHGDTSRVLAVGVQLDEVGDADFVTIPRPDTLAPIELWVTTAEGSAVVPRVTLLADGVEVRTADGAHPDARPSWWDGAAGDLTVKVEDANGGGGDGAWAVLHVRIWEEGISEAAPWEIEPNAPEAPQVLPVGEWAVVGRLEAEGDVDAFEIGGAEVGQNVCVRCSGWTVGSSTPIAWEAGVWSHTEDPTAPERPILDVGVASTGAASLPLILTVRSADHYGADTFYSCSAWVREHHCAGIE